MKDPTPFTDFCDAVCAQVRFRPDRAAILSELWTIWRTTPTP